ncbi:MAG TPA: response regulator [Actinomycetota bacterium]|jgi:DNA-binding NarL/FixJ family response regulator|nr:response regulator [Actinomycetota bacterium]
MSVRLVIAEDTEHVRKMLVDILDFHGFEVVAEASSGEEALRRVEDTNPDVVVIGQDLWDVDGVEATRRIHDRGPEPQVIIYAACVDGDIESRAREAGAAACVSRKSGIETLAREVAAITFGFGAEVQASLD